MTAHEPAIMPELSIFTPLIGEAFTIVYKSDHCFPVTLEDATESTNFPYPGRTRQAFQVQFRSAEHGPSGFLPQRIYAVEHPALGAMDMFLVPIGPPRDGRSGFLYQAVFN